MKKKKIDVTPSFYRIRIRPPTFDEYRVPEWASIVSGSIIKNAKVTMGKKGSKWLVQSILIPRKNISKTEALRYAKQIFKKIEATKGLAW